MEVKALVSFKNIFMCMSASCDAEEFVKSRCFIWRRAVYDLYG